MTAATSQSFEREIVAPGEMMPDLDGAEWLAIDVETRPKPGFEKVKKASLHPWRSEIFSYSLTVPGKSFYFPLRHRGPDAARWNLDPDNAFYYLRETLKTQKEIFNHHLKFDAKCLALAGVNLLDMPAPKLYCTYVGGIIDDERHPSHRLKDLMWTCCGKPPVEEKVKDRMLRELGQKKDCQDWSYLPVDVMGPYGCADGEGAALLREYQLPRIDRQELGGVLKLEMQVMKSLIESELKGFSVDVERLKLDQVRLMDQMVKFEARIEQVCGVSFNPESPGEIADVVHNRLGMPILRHTKKGEPRFDKEALDEYIRQFPQWAELFFLIKQVRRLSHLLKSFVNSYLKHHVDGVVHSNFNQNTAVTGRMTSNDPNAQQVSGEQKWELPWDESQTWIAPGARQYFVPRPGHSLLLFDYSQIEYRIFVHYTQSQRLIEAYRSDPNLDLHQWVADEVLEGKIPRRPAKNINFGVIYGMGGEKTVLSMAHAGAKITMAEGDAILKFYHEQIPEVKPLQRNFGKRLKERGYVKTVIGRRRRAAKNLYAGKGEKDEDDKGLLPYQALNAGCQGSATEVLKNRMAACHEAGVNPLVTIHDEMIFEVPTESALQTASQLKPFLEYFVDNKAQPILKVPIYVGCKITDTRWSEAREVDFSGAEARPA